MKNTQTDFDRIFEAWKAVEGVGDVVVHNEIAVLEANGANAMSAAVSYVKHKDFYRAYIKKAIVATPNISIFFKIVKEISEEAYIFISNGHDFINPIEYFQFKDSFESEKNDKIFEMRSYSRYLAYAFRRIVEQEDEAKKKSMLRGLLGM